MFSEIFEMLSSSLLNLDEKRYISILSNIPCDVTALLTQESNNSNKNSVLHELSLNIGKEDHLFTFLSRITVHVIPKKYENSLLTLKILINQQNKDGKTPLHLAIMTGRKKLVKHFISYGGDLQILDFQGQGPIHMATISGQLSLLTLFHKIHQLSINTKDKNGRTPLHIAAFEGQEQSSTLLIAWSENMNEVDNEGLTPLHLAVVAKSYRIIRHLLMRGASRQAKNNQGTSAFELAQRVGASEQIKEALEEPFCLSNLNPIKSPLQPVTNSYNSFVFYVITFYLRYILVFLYLVPKVEFIYDLIFLALFTINTILFQIVSNVDPGYEKVNEKMGFLELYEKYNGDFVCAYCEVRRPYHIKHCQHCNRCVRKFDHHCPWIHNCVGEGNHRVFFWFLVLTESDFLFNFIIGLLHYLGFSSQNSPFLTISEHSPYADYEVYFALGTAVFSILAFLVVSPLLYVQLTNLIQKTTTNERFAYNVRLTQKHKGKKKHEKATDSDTNSMLLIDDENDISQFNEVVSDSSGSELSIQAIKTRCCCLRRSVKVSWDQIPNQN